MGEFGEYSMPEPEASTDAPDIEPTSDSIPETEPTPEPAQEIPPSAAQWEDLSVSADGWEPLPDPPVESGEAPNDGGGGNVEQTEYYHGAEDTKTEQSIDGHNPSWDAPPDATVVEEAPLELEPSPDPVFESSPVDETIPTDGSG